MIIVKKVLSKLQLLGIILIVIGMPLGKFINSLGGIILISAWILSGDLLKKITAFKNNKVALSISSIFLLYIFGLFFSLDIEEAIHEIRIVLPILLFPLVFSSITLSKKEVYYLLHLFVFSVLVNSFISYYYYLDNPNQEYRQIIHFVSHIRYSLMLVLSIHIMLFYSIQSSWIYRLIALFISIWLMYFMSIYESATGVVVFIATLVTAVLFIVINSNSKKLKTRVLLGFMSIIILISIFVLSEYRSYFNSEEFDPKTLDKTTINGVAYDVFDNNGTLENGNYTWKYYCGQEMKKSWKEVLKQGGYEHQSEYSEAALLRYLTSKGLRKDSVGVYSLSKEDITNVCNGETNYLSASQNGFQRRLNELFYELDRYMVGEDPSQSSMIARLYYWEAAISIIKKNYLTGVGTGSLHITLNKEYNLINSALSNDSRKLVHNQFLSIAVQFGILGLAWFLFTLFSPFIFNNNSSYIAIIFLSIFIVSCLSEDTLNTQAGATFFSFFFSFFFVRRLTE